mgnify:CR=1 FL=1
MLNFHLFLYSQYHLYTEIIDGIKGYIYVSYEDFLEIFQNFSLLKLNLTFLDKIQKIDLLQTNGYKSVERPTKEDYEAFDLYNMYMSATTCVIDNELWNRGYAV